MANNMKITEAIQRLSYTISKANKPNETDKLALNRIIQDLNKSAEQTTQEHVLFAKLYALLFRNFSMHYNDLVFASKQLNKQLEYPLQYHLQLLQSELQRVSMDDFFKSKGVTDPNLRRDNFEQYKTLFKEIDVNEFKEVYESWDLENTTAHFVHNVNQSIINFKNNV
jgi:hypothetical protein